MLEGYEMKMVQIQPSDEMTSRDDFKGGPDNFREAKSINDD